MHAVGCDVARRAFMSIQLYNQVAGLIMLRAPQLT